MSTTAASGLKHATQRQAIEAALGNEQVTRQRVERLEKEIRQLKRDVSCQPDGGLHQLAVWQNMTWRVVMERSLWGRLRWLLTGK